MTNANRPTPTAATSGHWFKSTFSDNAASCVEVRFTTNHVHIRDSKYRRNPTNNPTHEPVITITPTEWAEFLHAVTAHHATEPDAALTVEVTQTGTATLRTPRTATTLAFTTAEWQAFLHGAKTHEFDHPHLTTKT